MKIAGFRARSVSRVRSKMSRFRNTVFALWRFWIQALIFAGYLSDYYGVFSPSKRDLKFNFGR
jgi:hypothetical protein